MTGRLTEEQGKRYEEIRKELEGKFATVECKPYHIHYVKSEEEADVVVSKHHVETDFLAVGIACLKKTLIGSEDSEVKVFNKEMISSDFMSLALRCCPDIKSSPINALFGVEEEISGIVYNTFSDKTFSTATAGLVVCNTVTLEVLRGNHMLEGTENLEFEYFDDTTDAQKKAYNIIKLIYIASILGTMFEIYK